MLVKIRFPWQRFIDSDISYQIVRGHKVWWLLIEHDIKTDMNV